MNIFFNKNYFYNSLYTILFHNRRKDNKLLQFDKISEPETVIGEVASIWRNLVYNGQNEGSRS